MYSLLLWFIIHICFDFMNSLTLSFTSYQTFIFLEILFKIRNQHKILRKKVEKKFYFLSKPLKITFWTPKLQTLIKPIGNIFDLRHPKKTPLNWSFLIKWYPCLHISLFCYSLAVHNNLALNLKRKQVLTPYFYML